MTDNQFQAAYDKLIARAWSDEKFKARLLAEPAAVLAQNGIDVPAGREVRVVEDTDTIAHLVLPLPPSDELGDEQLVGVAGGLRGLISTPFRKDLGGGRP